MSFFYPFPMPTMGMLNPTPNVEDSTLSHNGRVFVVPNLLSAPNTVDADFSVFGNAFITTSTLESFNNAYVLHVHGGNILHDNGAGGNFIEKGHIDITETVTIGKGLNLIPPAGTDFDLRVREKLMITNAAGSDIIVSLNQDTFVERHPNAALNPRPVFHFGTSNMEPLKVVFYGEIDNNKTPDQWENAINVKGTALFEEEVFFKKNATFDQSVIVGGQDMLSAVQAAKNMAQAALTTATSALTAANNAVTAANNAQTTANNAMTAANNAQTTANNAMAAATNAMNAANLAMNQANAAIIAAQLANLAAQAAQLASTQALAAAQAALNAANSLSQAVSAIQNIVNFFPFWPGWLVILWYGKASKWLKKLIKLINKLLSLLSGFYKAINKFWGSLFGSKPALRVKGGYLGHKVYGNFKTGKQIQIGNLSPKDYGIGIRWGKGFAGLTVSRGTGGKDGVLYWGDRPDSELRFRYMGKFPKPPPGITGNYMEDLMVIYPKGKIIFNAMTYSYAWYLNSDLALKQNVEELSDITPKLRELKGIRFHWRPEAGVRGPDDGKQQFGVAAQDVEKLFPELVTTDPNGHKCVDYHQLTPLLLEAFKEQQQVIDAQNEKINAQDDRLRRLEAALERLCPNA